MLVCLFFSGPWFGGRERLVETTFVRTWDGETPSSASSLQWTRIITTGEWGRYIQGCEKCNISRETKAGKNATFPWNMVKNCVKMWIFYKFWDIFGRKRPKYPSKLWISPQNCKYFPPKATFPGNEMTKFHILSMHAGDKQNMQMYSPLPVRRLYLIRSSSWCFVGNWVILMLPVIFSEIRIGF